MENQLTNKSADSVKVYYDSQVWGQMMAMATVLVQSGALPKDVKNAQQCIVKMQTGYEMGLTPMRSMQELYIVNGAVNIWGKGIVRRVKEHGWDIKYEYDNEDEPTICTVTVKRDKEILKQKFTYQMAEKSGYTKTSDGSLKPGWLPGANRQLKLGYNALSMLIKKHIPEVLGPIDDLVEVAEDRVATELVVKNETPKIQKKKKEEKVQVFTALSVEDYQKELDEILNSYGEGRGGMEKKILSKYGKDDENFTLKDLSLIQVVGAIQLVKMNESGVKSIKDLNRK